MIAIAITAAFGWLRHNSSVAAIGEGGRELHRDEPSVIPPRRP
jgi:hypothetical protein